MVFREKNRLVLSIVLNGELSLLHIAFLYLSSRTAGTVCDHLESFQKHSMHSIIFFDLAAERVTVDLLKRFDAVVLHYTVPLFTEKLSPILKTFLREAPLKKIVFIQDEYRQVNSVRENLAYIKADLLFTCVPEEEIENVYPKDILPHLTKINTLTGYIPEKMMTLGKRVPYEERPKDVVYRARRLSAWYGRLGREKWQISDRFKKDAFQYRLTSDLSYQEEHRIYGEKWIDFLSHAKAALGCESGASVFDFTGEIQKKVEAYESVYPEATLEFLEEKFFPSLDGKIYMNQISPRCFECAALRTLMILYEGHYSGILKPWRHYVPLKKDHSNMKEIVEVLRDKEKWTAITEQAYQEVACNPLYSYAGFIKKFDAALTQHVSALTPKMSRSETKTPKLFGAVEKLSLRDLIFFAIPRFFLQASRFFPQKIEKKIFCGYQRFIVYVRKNLVTLSYVKQFFILFRKYSRKFFQEPLFWRAKFRQELMLVEKIMEYCDHFYEAMGWYPYTYSYNIVTQTLTLHLTDEKTLSKNSLRSLTVSGQVTKLHITSEKSWGLPLQLKNLNCVLQKGREIFDLLQKTSSF